MAYLGFARKYRPQNFSDLVGQEIIVKVLENSLRLNKISHAYVFSGPKGVGKTSTARILAKALNCLDPLNKPCDNCPSCISIREGKAMNVIEIDAASHTSVENIRDLRENVKYASAEGNYKVYIIDESHMLSQPAFNAFLKTLEEPPTHVVFILATTEPRKIPITVMSRCQHLQFRRIPIDLIRERLRFICDKEKIKAQEEALYLIAANSEGSMRDALTLLDQITSFTENVNVNNVNLLLGITDIEILSQLTEYIINGEKEKIIEKIEFLNNNGTDFKILTRDLIYFLRNILIGKISYSYVFDIGESHSKVIKTLSNITSEEHLILLLKELINAESLIKISLFPRIIFEITLLKLSLLSHFKNITEVIDEYKESINYTTENDKVTLGNSIKENLVLPDNTNLTRENLSSIWSKYLEKLEERNPLLAMKIKYADTQFDNNEIKLIYNGGAVVYADSVKEFISEIRKDMNELIPNIKITISERESKPKDIKNEAINNPLVKQTLQLFEGIIYNIKPKKGGSNNV
jgi:DNA polymerase-3 subunit gamma/tau